MATLTYSPEEVAVIFRGKIITGYADGTFIQVKRLNPTWTEVSGADGEVTRTKSNDRRGSIMITLTQASPSNDDLTNAFVEDETNGDGSGEALVVDASGRSIYGTDSCWIPQVPDGEFGKELSNRTWELRCAALNVYHGGSNRAAVGT